METYKLQLSSLNFNRVKKSLKMNLSNSNGKIKKK